jgi:hypothetical protein
MMIKKDHPSKQHPLLVICSLKNSRSSTVVFRLVLAVTSFDWRSVIAAGSVYDSITFA